MIGKRLFVLCAVERHRFFQMDASRTAVNERPLSSRNPNGGSWPIV